MSFVTRLAAAAILSVLAALPLAAQDGSLTISVGFGPTAEVPDPRTGYNGWMSNQTGVTETLMGIDYELNLYPRLAEGIDQASPTTWRVTLREGLLFHDGTPVTAQAVVDAISPISEEGNPAHNARIANLLDLASLSADGDRVVVFDTNSPNAAFPLNPVRARPRGSWPRLRRIPDQRDRPLHLPRSDPRTALPRRSQPKLSPWRTRS